MMDPSDDPFARYWGRRVIILGAAGFIGRWLARRLVANQAKVYLVVRHSIAAQSVFDQYGIKGVIIEQHLDSGDTLADLFHKIKPSIVFNMVDFPPDQSEIQEDSAFRLNADLVVALCDCVAGTRDPSWEGQDIVQIGSALEYGDESDWAEETNPSPKTVYGRSKLAGTHFLKGCARAYGIKGTVVRTFSVYGPGERPSNLLPTLFSATRQEPSRPLYHSDTMHDWTYVEDVAEGLGRIGLSPMPHGQVVNLATGRWTCARDFVDIASQTLRIPDDRAPVRIQHDHPITHPPVPLTRLKMMTGWAPTTDIQEGILRTAQFENITLQGKLKSDS